MTSAIIPAYNEQGRVGRTVAALRAAHVADEVIVVDDGSTDGTSHEASSVGAKVVRIHRNRGKREALAAGVRAARGNILVFVDADVCETAEQTAALVAPVAAGEADMTIATLPVIPGAGGGFGLVVRLARWGIRRATGRSMGAPLSGQRALRRMVWDRARGLAPGFGTEVALTIDAICAGFRVIEIPTDMTHRVTGRDLSGVRHRARQFIAVARALWARRHWRYYRPPEPTQ